MKRLSIIIGLLFCITAMASALDKYVSILPVAVNVYDTPTADGKVMGTIAPKQEVMVYVTNGDWTIIDYQGQVGYVASACLKKVDSETSTNTNQTQPQTTTPQQTQTKTEPQTAAQPQQQPQQQPATKPNATTEAQPKLNMPSKSLGNQTFSLYDQAESYKLINSRDNKSDLFDCGGSMYFELAYHMPTYVNPHHQDDWDGIPWLTPFHLHGGAFSMGGIIPVWGPIGLDLGWSMDITYGKYAINEFYYDVTHNNYTDQKYFGSQYKDASRFRLTMPFYLMPVFGLEVAHRQFVRLHTGPRFTLYFLDQVNFNYIDEYGDKKYDSYELYSIGEKNNAHRTFGISWYLGVSYSYKSIGFRVAYEWGLIGRYKNDYYNAGLNRKELYDPRYNNLTASLFIPINF